jgi:NADH-quinone oxidoreductase subunit J
MSDPRRIILLASLLGAAGMWLLLPRGRSGGRGAGVILATAALGLFASQIPRLGDWLSSSVFFLLAGTTLVSAAAAVTLRNPVYCAIWFGMSLVGTAGLFLFQGAQFLAVATIVVYAGAILVTFLFVLMLASPSGRAAYDRMSWEAMVSAAAGAMLVGILTITVTGALTGPQPFQPQRQVTDADRLHGVLSERHMVRIGHELYDHYLVPIEAAGVLLLAALVGAAVIVGHHRPNLVAGGPSGDEGPAARGEGPAARDEGEGGRHAQ